MVVVGYGIESVRPVAEYTGSALRIVIVFYQKKAKRFWLMQLPYPVNALLTSMTCLVAL
jgi:hypothetical protein